MASSVPIQVPVGGANRLDGDLGLLPDAKGLIVFVHGSGSSRHSPRNQHVARVLQQHRFATLLIDLLTQREEEVDEHTGQFRFDIELLAERVVRIVRAVKDRADTAALPVGLFGASTGGGAALVAAAQLSEIGAVVSRGGRPDLAEQALPAVAAPTLLIVGSLDTAVIAMNRTAMAQMRAPVTLEIVPGATHLFEEPGTLDRVASLAAGWFERHLAAAVTTARRDSTDSVSR